MQSQFFKVLAETSPLQDGMLARLYCTVTPTRTVVVVWRGNINVPLWFIVQTEKGDLHNVSFTSCHWAKGICLLSSDCTRIPPNDNTSATLEPRGRPNKPVARSIDEA